MTQRKRTISSRTDGRVVIHVFVHPDVRRALHMISMHDDVCADETLRVMIKKEMEARGFPIADGLLSPA